MLYLVSIELPPRTTRYCIVLVKYYNKQVRSEILGPRYMYLHTNKVPVCRSLLLLLLLFFFPLYNNNSEDFL